MLLLLAVQHGSAVASNDCVTQLVAQYNQLPCIAVQHDTVLLLPAASASQVGSYGDPGRDPRGWTVTVAYAAVVPSTELGVAAAVSDATDTLT